MSNMASDTDVDTMEPAPSVPPVYQADLTKGMEHMRAYVSVPIRAKQPPKKPDTATPEEEQEESTDQRKNPSEEPSTYGVPPSALPTTKATAINDCQSHTNTTSAASSSSSNPNHRTDPNRFGSRYLQEEDDIFAFNAWDDVPLTDSFLAFAESQYAFQRSNPVSAFDASRFNSAPQKWWDKFYANNSANFFKDRRWLFKEFPVLRDVCAADAGPVTVLEVGCGAGNTAFPLMKESKNPGLVMHCCDFSRQAVRVVAESEMFDAEKMKAEVWDVATVGEPAQDGITGRISLPPGVEQNSVDLVILVFVFSALSPSQWAQALRNLYAALKPGGKILFRDYGRGDLAQVRFKKGRWLQDNFYVRGDGTRVYFFDKDQLAQIFAGPRPDNARSENDSKDEATQALIGSPTFEILDLKVDRRMLVNRQRRLKMYRCWMQGHFQKPEASITTNN